MKYCFLILLLLSELANAQNAGKADYIQMSQDFVYAAKAGGDTKLYVDSFSNAGEQDISRQLRNDNDKKAFFINLYNAYTQTILKANPDKYKKRNAFFKSRQINFAGNKISLDKIEHGFLRHSKVKWSLGYFGKLFPGRLERKFRVSRVDYRIHFTLNCGAQSCPAIAYYKPESLDEELNLATKTYLQQEAVYNRAGNTLSLPALMSWFRGDFHGKKNVLRICKNLGIMPEGAHPKIKYKKYNWQLYLSNYKN